MFDKRVLISTITPVSGGVPQMARFVVEQLRRLGLEPVIAYYQPYRIAPDLSAPSYRLLRGSVSERQHRVFDDVEAHALGAWLPELEFTHYSPTRLWKKLITSCKYHVSVSGNCLAATPFLSTGKPFWAWVATPWHEDRKDRVKGFSLPRQWLDKFVIAPVIMRLEKRILNTGNVVALSDYTRRQLSAIAGGDTVKQVLPMAVDTGLFAPKRKRNSVKTIGFVGRLDDPRKNIGLFVDALAHCQKNNRDIHGVLIGGAVSDEIDQRIRTLGLANQIMIIDSIERERLPDYLVRMDAFFIPSHQEGLCIAALEAMSCGVPVVSTKCGGPEEFVIHGETGLLVEADAEQAAKSILNILNNKRMREDLSKRAREFIESRYSVDAVQEQLSKSFQKTFAND